MPDNVIEIRGEQATNAIQDMHVRASFVPASLNEESRTVDLVFATENPVRKMTWDGPVEEVLSFKAGHARMDRLNNGANLLDNHNRYGSVTENVLGVVEKAWTKAREGWATVRFGKGERAEKAWQDVKDGILRSISVGYRVYKYEVTREEGKLDLYRATDWEAMEVSFVSIPADAGASVRSNEQTKIHFPEATPGSTNTNNQNRMADENKKPGSQPAEDTRSAPATPPAAPAVDADKVRTEAIAAERGRVQAIQVAVRQAGLGAEFAQTYIDGGQTADETRAAVLAELEKRQAEIDNSNQDTKLTGKGEVEKRRLAVESGLMLRSGQASVLKLDDEAQTLGRSFRGHTLLDIAKDCLNRAGEKWDGMLPMEIVGRAITSSSSDFPVILEGTIRRMLLANYEATADTWRRFCYVGSVSDFREHKRLRMGTLSRLDKMAENEEYKNKSIPDAELERIYAETYGNTINVSRKMIVNDDLDAFSRLAQMLGRAAARSIEIDVYSLFALNSGNGPTMEDGNPLFHSASHFNIGTGATISVDSLDADRVLMAQQMDPSQNDYLDIRPSILVLPIGLGGTARVINSSTYDPESSSPLQKPNKVQGLFQDIVDTPRLSGTARYLFADPMVEPVFEVAFLNGVQTPFMEMNEPFNVDGMQWKIRLDYGFGAIGWRGVVKNAGTA